MTSPPTIDLETAARRYDALLLDAYGVLLHSTGAFDGAAECIDFLHRQNVPFWVVTNDASRLPETAARKYRTFGLDIDADQILTSGRMLTPYVQSNDLEGADAAVLGTDDSKAYAREAGLNLVDPRQRSFDVFVLGDDAGFPFRESVDASLSRIIRRFDDQRPVKLTVPNPDLMYQRGTDVYGVAVGALAEMFETILGERFPGRSPTFDRLGKPHPPMFREAIDRAGTGRLALIGDQLATDIAGANRAGLDSIFVGGGVTNLDEALDESEVRPDFLMPSLRPGASEEG